MKDDKGKGLASIIVGIGKPKAGGDDEEEMGSDDSEEESDDYEPSEEATAAGHALAKALESGDGSEIARAFANLKELC